MITRARPASVFTGLVGRKTRLREVDAGDRRTLIGFDRDLLGDAHHRPHCRPHYLHWAAHRADGTGSCEDVQFAIETMRGGVLVGSMTVQADPASGRFSYGVGIGPRHRRCGYAADAITVLLAFMFHQHAYLACDVGIHGSNFASLTLHAGLGFRERERVLDAELCRGTFTFMVGMSVTADQFAGLPLTGHPGRGRHWRNPRGRHWSTPYTHPLL
nr:GNAT family protein [Kibdelosporangium sp. MJ126-NF4]CEL13812.1 probable acetyltransferase [Kibdelosporangium sp. MJ126-NF4]CTQ88180.1 probable acetyltransferase [Kibdelosporangium sp. MJ126-NF4]